MCMQPNKIRPFQKWHWAGDEIVYEPIIPASRILPGTRTRQYPIDIRQFLSIQGNAVIRKHIQIIYDSLSPEDQRLFTSRQRGAFDFRVRKVLNYVRSNLRYKRTGRSIDDWCFPEETLALKGGDCEDLSFVIATMLEASGISAYCLRVALGFIVEHRDKRSAVKGHHAWVMYFDEGGTWQILEPLILSRSNTKQSSSRANLTTAKTDSADDFEYIPHFVFNSEHLWRVRTPDRAAAEPQFKDYVTEREFWKGFNPKFAISVHESIYNEALDQLSQEDLDIVKQRSLWADVNTLAYDPRDHFDFAYIEEGWAKIQKRLATGEITDFAYAVHAIADFYAHTLYGEVALQADGTLAHYDPDAGIPSDQLIYDFSKFPELPDCKQSVAQAEELWRGKLISGQWWRWYTSFPNDLEKKKEFATRFCLPDHDFVAVDSPTPKDDHLYDKVKYKSQYALRRNAAVQHIRKAYEQWQGATH